VLPVPGEQVNLDHHGAQQGKAQRDPGEWHQPSGIDQSFPSVNFPVP
jgi:hypothetical protein